MRVVSWLSSELGVLEQFMCTLVLLQRLAFLELRAFGCRSERVRRVIC